MSRTCSVRIERPNQKPLNLRTVAAIQGKIVKQGKRNELSRLFNRKRDKDEIDAWRHDLNRILHTFNVRSAGLFWQLPLRIPSQTELLIDNHAMLSDIHRVALEGQGGARDQQPSVSVPP